MKSWIAIATLLTLALAGCADTEPEPATVAALTIQEDPQNATVDPTPWALGDWFGHHLFFGASDTQGFHINVMIDREDSESWHFVSDDAEVARFEEVLDIPILGNIAKSDLDTTAFGGQSAVYDFPLFDGKTWQGNVKYDLFENDVYDLTFTATYSDDVTPFGDGRPGYEIEGALVNGTVVLETDYDPSFGWYNDYTVYPITGPGDDFIFRSIHMGSGHNWTGTAYEYDSQELVDEQGSMILPAAQANDPVNPLQISVSAESTHLIMLEHCFAFAGASDARLRSPAGEMYACQSVALPDSPDPNTWSGVGDGFFDEIQHESGDWLYNRASAGFVAGGGLQLWELTEKEIVFA